VQVGCGGGGGGVECVEGSAAGCLKVADVRDALPGLLVSARWRAR
jgi:hypothetical protein